MFKSLNWETFSKSKNEFMIYLNPVRETSDQSRNSRTKIRAGLTVTGAELEQKQPQYSNEKNNFPLKFWIEKSLEYLQNLILPLMIQKLERLLSSMDDQYLIKQQQQQQQNQTNSENSRDSETRTNKLTIDDDKRIRSIKDSNLEDLLLSIAFSLVCLNYTKLFCFLLICIITLIHS